MPKTPAYFCHVGILTKNPKRLLRFYQDKLRFKPVSTVFIPAEMMRHIFGLALGCRMIRLVLDNIRVEIFCPESGKLIGKTPQTIGYNHWGYFVKDKQGFCRQLEQRGVKVIKVKREEHWVYFLKDPDGNRIELMEFLK